MPKYIVYQENDEFTIEVPSDARVYLTGGGAREDQSGILKVVRDIEQKNHEGEGYTHYSHEENILAQYPRVHTIRCVDEVTRTERELA